MAKSVLESVTRKETLRKSSFLAVGSVIDRKAFVWKKEALDSVIHKIDDWQKRFDPPWFLIVRYSSSAIDQQLQAGNTSMARRGAPNAAKDPLALVSGMRAAIMPSSNQRGPLFLPECAMETSPITHSSARLGRLLGGDQRWYIVDSVSFESRVDISQLSRDVRHLAAKLCQADPIAFGLLNCKGIMPISQQHDSSQGASQRQPIALNIVFRIPPGMDTLFSLRQMLLMPDLRMSVTRRVRVARELAKSISYVHVFNFVHKNVRPESVLCFEDTTQSRSHTFLVGFDAFRAADGATRLQGDMSWEKNLYRHPERQGDFPSEKYNMQHDIYSLGVCLLEIGLWESFVEYTYQDDTLQPQTGKCYSQFQQWLTGVSSDARMAFSYDLPWQVKDYLVEVARSELPARMGEKYATVVVACLTCLDPTSTISSNSTNEPEEQSMTVAVRFIEKTLLLLNEISV
ncbi:hypothetical protein M409DRAFT_37762 [Zasmidium cellare ATCC 36951]|uniref:Protein kinase domain-containing protein n=1 Tax=Zasmidium cellare ATCC 36951 TaxID=1080233 RepID=A0A6A6C4P9_ZASCE|nr:uncharacterized protein M409DRAFT_37762 [Zasmidium cellare ATCC 36951]KAF2160356.1 hypothetical protein M409DRAFT_37762 [Zasmidium cellare ATCC 36951]